MGTKQRLSHEERAKIEAQLKAHYGNLGLIAAENGVSRAYVRHLALSAGVHYYTQEARSQRSPAVALKQARVVRATARNARIEELGRRWNAGESCAVIAAAMGFPSQTYAASYVARLRSTPHAPLFPYRRTRAITVPEATPLPTLLPACPACKSRERVTTSPAESATRGAFFCPCNEAGSPGDSGHFNA